MAGLVLLLEGGPDAATDQAMDATVFDYFAAEIMRRAETETQAFLTQCALLPVMDARSTARLTGNARAETILRDLVRRNYFINRLPGGSMRYEFHPLFRSYLREELHRRRSAGERRAMQQKAGRILADGGEYSAAVELLSDAGAVDELVTLVLDHAEKLIAAGRHQTLTLWLQAIPQESYRSRPWLTYWLGVSRTPYDIVAAKDHFESAYAAFSAAGDVTGCYSSWSGIAECYNLMWGDFEGVDLWLEEFARLRSRYPRYPSVETEIRAQAALFGILIFLRPHHPDCAAARKTVEEMLVHAADPEFRIRALSNLALYYSWTGKFTDMHRVVDASEAIVAQEPVSPLSRIMVKIHHGTLCWLVGRPQEVHALLGEALRIADLSGVHLLDAFVSFQYAYVHGIQDDPEAMLVALKSLKEQLSPHRRIDIAHYYFQMSWCKSLSRDYVEAQCAANDMLAILEGARAKISQYEGLAVHMPTALGRFGLAAVLVETGEYAQADGLFELGLQFSRALNSLHLEFLGLMLRAYSWLKQGDEKACRTDLERALGIAAGEHGYWTFPLWDGRKVSQVCAFALQRGIEPDYVRALIRKWRLLPPEETAAPAFWPWPVRIHTLGRLCVLVDDKEVKPSGKTREMLKAIIALGGCDVHGQRISDLLWPDAEGDQARTSFKITLHRLRKLIGPQCLLQNDGRLTLDPRLVWVDSWTFERSLTELESAAEEELGNLAAEAVHGYQTGFLPDDDAPWLRTEQERLRNRFLRVIDQAAAGLCRQKQWQAAMECYQSALDTDPLAERFYQGLMRCHHRLGQAAEGLVVYRRCQEVLAAGLGIQPSPPTESLHQQLQHLNT